MNAGIRLLGFAAGTAAVFGLAFAAGAWAGPLGGADDPGSEHGHGEGHDHAADSAHGEAAGHLPGGLQISQDGYTLVLERTRLDPGTREVSFAIEGPDGTPVTDLAVVHDKELHLIVVRRDLTGFQHVHPSRDARGVWHTDLDLLPGAWRLFADFAPGPDADPAGGADQAPLTLGADLLVSGEPEWAAPGSEPAAGVVRTAEVDGFTVQQAGDLGAGHQGLLTFTVTRDGEPVRELEPYLGARGHLVALREGDLAYLHVHPSDLAGTPGNQVSFVAGTPSVGTYRLFLDFRVDGVVHTASFVLAASGGAR